MAQTCTRIRTHLSSTTLLLSDCFIKHGSKPGEVGSGIIRPKHDAHLVARRLNERSDVLAAQVCNDLGIFVKVIVHFDVVAVAEAAAHFDVHVLETQRDRMIFLHRDVPLTLGVRKVALVNVVRRLQHSGRLINKGATASDDFVLDSKTFVVDGRIG